jgi:hypothetical protein
MIRCSVGRVDSLRFNPSFSLYLYPGRLNVSRALERAKLHWKLLQVVT